MKYFVKSFFKAVMFYRYMKSITPLIRNVGF